MLRALKKISQLLNKQEKMQVSLLMVGVVIRSLIEVAGVASIMPFIAVVSNPSVIDSNKYLSFIFKYFGFESHKAFLLFLGIIVFVIIILNNSLSALTEWFLIKFTWFRGHTLGKRLFAKYLSQPYTFFLNENTANLASNILNEVGNFLKGILRPLVEMIAKIVVTVFIFSLLVFLDPVLAFIVGIVLGSAYSLIFFSIRKKLARVGKERVEASRKLYLFTGEALSGIKDIRARNCESFFLDRFSEYSYMVNMNQSVQQIISQIPRFALEIIAFGGILLITLYFVGSQKETANIIPLLALYAFAGYRLMPALQGVFAGITTVRFNIAIIDRLSNDLSLLNSSINQIQQWDASIEPIRIHEKIELESICFQYPGAEEDVLKDLSLKIQANTMVGFAGITGGGKTTLIDIVLGLLTPQQGQLLVDGNPITENNVRAWLRTIGYVPQQIFLSDQSIRNNIAFGLKEPQIDDKRVEEAARIAQLHDFVMKELPHGYDTLVGERGVRLSGGQRQRIGIARAIYSDPDLLILDEATSSLDNVTEARVIDAIRELSRKKTVIMIAHRLTTLVDCDVIHFIVGGKIHQSGTYHQLNENCPEFRMMNKNN
jgi:ABC-type multidrug transport system fused ATPase/permease subunit